MPSRLPAHVGYNALVQASGPFEAHFRANLERPRRLHPSDVTRDFRDRKRDCSCVLGRAARETGEAM